MGAPSQAAILCGGLGERMRPLTETMPKPLAPVNGRPFLQSLIAQLREKGIRRVLLMTGYRGEMIREHFGDGSAFGVQIDYSHGPVEWDTGRRVWEARDRLDPRFMLLYSDNFALFDFAGLIDTHERLGRAVTCLLHHKAPGNIRAAPNGEVEAYDPGRTLAGLNMVELGYMIVERERMLARFDRPDVSFSRVLQRLAAEAELGGFVAGDAYHSISDPRRWKLAERYLAPKRILLIDRDGTINRRAPRGEYVSCWEEFVWNDKTVEAMQSLAVSGFSFVVISNQAGIARGMVSAAQVASINRRMALDLKKKGIEILDTLVCPHHWDDGCECRKPRPGLFYRASMEHLVRLDRTAYIGDDPRDCEAARNAGCLSVMIGPERNEPAGGGARAAFASESLPEAVPWIVARFESWEAEEGTGTAS